MNKVKTEPVPYDICDERVKTTLESIDVYNEEVELPNDVKVEYFALEEEEADNSNSVASFDGQEKGVQCKDSLELRSVLFARPYWTSRRTRTLIQAICGPNTNTLCAECKKTFTTHKRLRVHVRQHFTNTFCSCGVFSFQRDYILRHQRRSNCYSGGVFEVDRECFLEFRDLLLPHVTDQKQRKLILQGFPKTRPSVESGRDQSVPSPSSPSLSSLSTSSSLPRPRAIEPCTSKEPVPQAQHSISCSPSTSQLGCSEATDHKPTDSLDYDIEVKVSSLEKRLCRLSQDILHTNFELLRLNRLLRKRRAAAPESVPACS